MDFTALFFAHYTLLLVHGMERIWAKVRMEEYGSAALFFVLFPRGEPGKKVTLV
jgi:hypothetical protein